MDSDRSYPISPLPKCNSRNQYADYPQTSKNRKLLLHGQTLDKWTIWIVGIDVRAQRMESGNSGGRIRSEHVGN